MPSGARPSHQRSNNFLFSRRSLSLLWLHRANSSLPFTHSHTVFVKTQMLSSASLLRSWTTEWTNYLFLRFFPSFLPPSIQAISIQISLVFRESFRLPLSTLRFTLENHMVFLFSSGWGSSSRHSSSSLPGERSLLSTFPHSSPPTHTSVDSTSEVNYSFFLFSYSQTLEKRWKVERLLNEYEWEASSTL